MIRNHNVARHGLAAMALLSSLLSTSALRAAEVSHATPEQTLAEIQSTFGAVPTFVTQLPAAALPGYWAFERDLELSDKTALDAKTKALISLAVAAQIPCQYCIWSDTNAAKAAGATDAEIGEAVAMAGLTRATSTLLNGLQVDFDTFKKEMGSAQ